MRNRAFYCLTVAMFALYVVLLIITLHAVSSLSVYIGFNTSFCRYICALRHGFVPAFTPTPGSTQTRQASILTTHCYTSQQQRHARPVHLHHVVTPGSSTQTHQTSSLTPSRNTWQQTRTHKTSALTTCHYTWQQHTQTHQ